MVEVGAALQGRWVNFTAPATAVDPGQWWIVIHTGATGGVARNRGDGADNWYGLNADEFTDGASNPFGTGAAGTGTLSVKISYTVGH